jgi:hypothetical protein
MYSEILCRHMGMLAALSETSLSDEIYVAAN